MIERKTLVIVISGVLVGGLLLGGLAIASGKDSSVSTLAAKVPFFGKMIKQQNGSASLQQLSEALKTLVEKRTITQEQSDIIMKRFEDTEKQRAALEQKKEKMTLKEYREYVMNKKGEPLAIFDDLVSEGVITESDLGAIKASIVEIGQKQQREQMLNGLKTLVDKGTITKEQSDKIQKKVEAAIQEREAQWKKVKEMTPEERLKYIQNKKEKSESPDPISQLVADGTITQEQADAVREVVPYDKG